MKKILRYLVIGVVAAVAFLIAIVAIFVAVFDANAYKQDLSEIVREQTGRDLQFHGEVDLTIFPALGMKLGAMSLSNAPGFGAQPMIKVSEASISVDMASLIAFAPEIDKLVLRDLEVNLITNKVGVTNWDDLVQQSVAQSPAAESSKSSTESSTDGAADSGSGSGGEIALKTAFGGLDLQNIRLLWLDEQAGQQFQVTDLDLSTGRIAANEIFPLKLHVDVEGDVDVALDFATNVEFLVEKQLLTLSEMSLKLNEFEIGGRLQLGDFAKTTPSLRFDLASENLDVDALLGTPPAAAPGPEAPADGAASTKAEDVQIALPMETLRGLDIDGKLAIANIKVQNLRLQDLELPLKAQDGQLALKPVRMKLYGGRVENAVVVDVRGDEPRYGVSKSLQDVQIGDLLRDFTGQETISGTLAAEVDLTTRGDWVSELKRRSNGSMNVSFVDGALQGFNLRHSIDTAKAKLRGESPPDQETLKTDFSALGLSGVIRNGVFSSDDLDLQAPLLRVGGQGSANLVDETVDYLVTAKLVGTLEGQAGGAADDLSGLEIPVSIKGPFTSAKVDVLLDEALKAQVDAEKEKLKAEIEAQKEALKQQLEAEKKALEAARKREAEKRKEIAEAKAKAELEAKKKELEEKLKQKLLD